MTPDFKAFKRLLASSRGLAAPLVTIDDPSVAEVIIQTKPDFIIVDMEHSTIDVKGLQNIVTAAAGLPVVARIRGPERSEIKRVLDTGVSGIIVPTIRNYQEAAEAVMNSIFPPNGQRGAGPGRASDYGLSFREYVSNNPAIILQIETQGAYEDIERIAKIENLDGLFIGPVDLTLSLGIEMDWNSPRFQGIIRKILETVRLLGKPCGIYCPLDGDLARSMARMGFSFLMLGMDKDAIRSSYGDVIASLRDFSEP
ncbi:MAG: aldolase/citrate lyase family protein [Thermoplasmataceae archaeon]